MNLFDPRRKRTNDTPELLGRRVVVPRLSILPCEDETVTLSTMIPASGVGRYTSRQVLRVVPDTKLPEIIAQYRADPESTLETLFNISLAPVSEPSDADFARDLKRNYESSTKPIPRSRLDYANLIESIEL